MGLNLTDIFGTIEELLPILATTTGHPELGLLAQKLIAIGEDEIARRRSEQNRTRAEVLADADATFAEARVANQELKDLGH